MAEGGVWGWTKARSYMVFHPALDLVLFNGAPETRKMVLETVDGMLAHRKQEADGRYVTRTEINFKTDEDLPGGDATPGLHVLRRHIAGPATRSICCRLWMRARRRWRISAPTGLDMLNLRDTWGKQVLAAAGPPSGRRCGATAAASASGSAETFAWQMSGDTKYLERL